MMPTNKSCRQREKTESKPTTTMANMKQSMSVDYIFFIAVTCRTFDILLFAISNVRQNDESNFEKWASFVVSGMREGKKIAPSTSSGAICRFDLFKPYAIRHC